LRLRAVLRVRVAPSVRSCASWLRCGNAGPGTLLKVTAMPGKHVPPGPLNLLERANDLLGAVPPTNGWMLELGTEHAPNPTDAGVDGTGVKTGYRIYISGDTLLIDDLKAIPERYPDVDLMLIHLGTFVLLVVGLREATEQHVTHVHACSGGTTIPGPHAPLLMVTMDAKMGVQLVHLIRPDVTVPIHYDDYGAFCVRYAVYE
jgi:hypothetical protein